ncbi:flagellar motor switch protein FliM [Anaeromyxobacter paludicola]|uniref:Flagellar motor switch protein FliM n=1 Tax=Anaeromyxobacter paludicola TaxID=2918171 RepID=A0ABN6N471_9BACT|nr:FliM/FliN family flagellar motor switch protein [Anaeromyxobacter paludicola]BDG07991.1 flagellar motor switch protein FliM [Anaeromyxobacter paludicola]
MPATLTPEEIKALMSAVQDGRVQPEATLDQHDNTVVPYDLTSQDRIIRGQMPTLDAINEQVASMLGIGLAGRTRLTLAVTSAPATLLKFSDLVPVTAPPASVCVLGLGSAYGFALAVLEPGLGEALLSAALGDRRGKREQADARREFTAIEQMVLRRLLVILTDAMRTAWHPVLPFDPEVLRFEADPRMAAIAPPTDVGIITAFEIKGGIEGRLQLVIPYASVEPAKSKLCSPRRLSQRGDDRFADALAREMEQVRVDVKGLLGRTTIPFSRLLDLQVGDVLLLDSDEGSPLSILVEGREKLSGSPTVQGGSLALVVEDQLRPPLPPSLTPPLPAPSAAPAPRPAVALP